MVATNNEGLDFSDVRLAVLGSLEDLGNPLCREVFSYWSRLNSVGSLREFDLIDVPEVIPFMVVLERTDDGQSFRFKIVGQSIVEAAMVDLTDEILSAKTKEAPLTTKICQKVVERQSPVFTNNSFRVESIGRTLHFEETIGLPLFEPSGELAQIVLVHGPK